MANENNDIIDIVKKSKILLLDIEGTTTSISFVKDKLFPYAEENVKEFLGSQWEDKDVQETVTELRKLAVEDQEKAVDGVVTIPGEDASKEEQIESLVKSVKWQMACDRKVGPLKRLQGLIWKQGYDKGEIKGHVYDDVSSALELWRSVEGHKVYIYSSGSVQAQKFLFGQSVIGDLLPLIDGHFDTAVGAKQEEGSYKTIAEKIGCKPNEILFLTDVLKEAEAARRAGLAAALVSREGNAALPAEATSFPLLYSLAELAVNNKRKPDAQDEQNAKVLKTDVDQDVKTSSDPEKSPEIFTKNAKDEPEKMEVEEEIPANIKTTVEQPVTKVTFEKIETVLEEVTDINEVTDVPVCEIEPIVEDRVNNKTDEKEAEKMNAETAEQTDFVSKPNDDTKIQSDGQAPFAEETPPTIITEISDITHDSESLSEVAEIIEDLEPVVEEPTTAQDIELQNVGDVLEKECDEILSKVQDVTNLDNIPLKPLLNPIAEETMETDNTDSNDFVDRILDSELELEMKQCGDSDLNVVESESKTKTVVQECEGDVPATDKFIDETSEVKDKATKKEEGKTVEKIDEKGLHEAEENTKAKVEDVKNKIPTDSTVEVKEDEGKGNDSNSMKSQTESTDIDKTEEINQNKKEIVETVKNREKDSRTETMEKSIETNTNQVEEKNNQIELEASDKTEASNADKKEPEEINSKRVENPIEADESVTRTTDHKVETQENKTEGNVETKESLNETELQVENKETSAEHSTMETDPPLESKVTEEDEMERETTETQINGKSTNGDAEMVNLNGDTCKNDDLSSRLSLENGEEEVNCSNGDATDEVQGQADTPADTDVPDIKVKTVATDESCNDPIEQPTEA